MRTSREIRPEAAARIRGFLGEVRRSPHDQQKRLRQQIRDLGFYISDFSRPDSGFTPADFDALVAQGTIRIVEGRTRP